MKLRTIAFLALLGAGISAPRAFAVSPADIRLPAAPIGPLTVPTVNPVHTINSASDQEWQMTFSGLPGGLDISNQTYFGWCADLDGEFSSNRNHPEVPYQLYSTYDTAHIPAAGQNANWDKVNWLLNHKGSTPRIVLQQVIWKLLSGSYDLSGSYLIPPDDSVYNQALTSGAGFVPGPGQTVAVLMYIDGFLPASQQDFQDLLIEVPMPPGCSGVIGDFVWSDLNNNGIQDAGEVGINGVTVQLYKGAIIPANLVATTVTGFSPVAYGFTPPGANAPGYYQFPGLCSGDYTVVVPPQPALSGYLPSNTFQGGNPAQDSNANPAPVNLPTDASVNETIDFGYFAPLPPALSCGASVGQINVLYSSALLASGGLTPYTFSAAGLPAWLTLNPITGALSGIPNIAGPITFSASVVDARNNAAGTTTTTCSILVNPPPTANCVVILAIQNVPITPVTMVGTGGAGAPYTFSASGLPNGLIMDANGTIHGTPTVSGTFSYSVTVTDKDGHSGTSFSCSVTVNPPPTATCVVVNAVQGIAITPVTMVGSGGAGGPYTFSAVGLPNGLTMSTTGTISGTSTVSGTFNYVVTVKDSAGNTGTVNCSVTVAPPPTATCVVINAVQGVAITPVTMIGSGGTGAPYTFSATGLPNGLIMSTTGTISGTSTVSGTFNYVVTVKDSAGNTGTVNCSVTVAPPPTATCIVINAIQGVAITPVTMVGSGGAGAPYTFSATGLPNGLVMSTTGTISGTSTVNGTFNYVVTVKDKNGNTGTVNCSVTVAPPPTATCIVINAIQGIAITPATMVGSGGAGAPYTFSATGLPTGLTMSTTGTISGTPTVSGTFNYVVTVKDKSGNTGTVNCSVTVAPPPTATCVVIYAVKGVAITPVTLVGSGGSGGPYTFTANGLPAGFGISTGGTISGTPTVTGTFTYVITVKDAAGHTGTLNCSVTVSSPCSANCIVVNAMQGVAITPVTLTGTGGAGAPYTFTATGLPNGITLSTSGTLSGMPTVSGTFNYVVTIKDKNGVPGTLNCSLTVTPAPVCAPTTFNFTGGNSASTGTAGNIRTFTAANGVQVKISAFSRNKSNGAWSTAYLGSYAPGLGVTDGSESGSDPTHKIDNIGTQNDYVLLEFSSPVVLNRAFLDAIGADSDLTLWIGTKTNPFTSHNTLNDALLTSLGFTEENLTSLTSTSRWADVNAGSVSGNVIVIAALVSDDSPEDEFKLSKLETSCPQSGGSTPSATCVAVSATQGTAIAPVTLIGTGGAGGAYTFTATGLPSGLTLSTTGTLSGTPSVSGTFNYVVTIKDKNGSSGTLNCSLTVNPVPVCLSSTTFNFAGGNSASTGTTGNIRTFTAPNGVQVKVSAFSRNKSTAAWSASYLGSYSPGLGVTDGTENGSDPTHKTDNLGAQLNYVMLEFSSPVVLNRAFLDSIGADSDMSLWIGTKTNPFTNHITLSDATLAGLGYNESNLTSSTATSRWADVNAGNVSGNVIVIAALVTDTTPEDAFKLAKLETVCR